MSNAGPKYLPKQQSPKQPIDDTKLSLAQVRILPLWSFVPVLKWGRQDWNLLRTES